MNRIALFVVLAACKGSSPSNAPASDMAPSSFKTFTCPKDLGPMHEAARIIDDSCVAKKTCAAECDQKSSAACLQAGYTIDNEDASADFYLRACRLQDPIGCLNYGAHLFIKKNATDDEGACAVEMFKLACNAKSLDGCAMQGRLLADMAATDADRASVRAFLQQKCDELGNFPCVVLAKKIDEGKLGPRDEKAITDALARACKTGLRDVCDKPIANVPY